MPTTLPGSSACLQATGSPAEVAAAVDGGGVQLFRASANDVIAGLVVAAPVNCPLIRTRASGAGVIAGYTKNTVKVMLRDPGADWAAPVTLPAAEVYDVTAAVSDRGDAVVAWLERDDEGPYRALAYVGRPAVCSGRRSCWRARPASPSGSTPGSRTAARRWCCSRARSPIARRSAWPCRSRSAHPARRSLRR